MLTVISFILFTAAASALTIWITRKDERNSSDGFFLGGRSLTFPIIAGSLLLTNLSTEQMVGLNGMAFKDGLSVMAWEVNAVIALIIMALLRGRSIPRPQSCRAGIDTQATAMARGARCSPLQEAQHALEQVWQE